MDGQYPDGPAYLALSSLSVVRFKGIFIHPNDNGSASCEITLHWFLNAFGWEWPYTTWDRSCGIVHNIDGFLPGPALTLPGDLVTVARKLKFPEEDYWCFPIGSSSFGGICHNEFFGKWFEANLASDSFGTAMPLFGYYLAGLMVLCTAITEAIVRWRPELAKCYCPEFISKRGLCPCLKDDEEMTPAIRNRTRVWNLRVLAVAYAFSCLLLLRTGVQLQAYLNEADSRVGGMHARLGSGFLSLSSVTFAAILVAMGCLIVRGKIEPTQSWMKEQGVDGDDTLMNLDQQKDDPNADDGTLL